jgi:hypothetical protein
MDAAGIRAETKISLFRSAAGRTGTLIGMAGAASTLAYGPNPYDRTGHEITLDEIERIRI